MRTNLSEIEAFGRPPRAGWVQRSCRDQWSVISVGSCVWPPNQQRTLDKLPSELAAQKFLLRACKLKKSRRGVVNRAQLTHLDQQVLPGVGGPQEEREEVVEEEEEVETERRDVPPPHLGPSSIHSGHGGGELSSELLVFCPRRRRPAGHGTGTGCSPCSSWCLSGKVYCQVLFLLLQQTTAKQKKKKHKKNLHFATANHSGRFPQTLKKFI